MLPNMFECWLVLIAFGIFRKQKLEKQLGAEMGRANRFLGHYTAPVLFKRHFSINCNLILIMFDCAFQLLLLFFFLLLFST